MSRPSTIFGAALLGMSFNDVPTVAQALCTLKDCGITHVDTAARYPPMMKGESERLLGEARAAEKGFTIDSKILMGSGQGELEASAVVKSLTESLQRLGVQHVRANLPFLSFYSILSLVNCAIKLAAHKELVFMLLPLNSFLAGQYTLPSQVRPHNAP